MTQGTTGEHDIFDRIARLAAHICGASGVAISFRTANSETVVGRHGASDRMGRDALEIPLHDVGDRVGTLAVAGAAGISDRQRDALEDLAAVTALLSRHEGPERAARLQRLRHDIRTPLSIIMGFAAVLEEEITDPGHKEDAAEILKGARRLIAMIDDFTGLPEAGNP